MILWSIEYNHRTKELNFHSKIQDTKTTQEDLEHQNLTCSRLSEVIRQIRERMEDGNGFIIKFQCKDEETLNMRFLENLVRSEGAYYKACHGLSKDHSMLIKLVYILYIRIRINVESAP